MALFQNSVLNKYLEGVNEHELNAAWQVFKAHFHNPEIQINIREAKEESYQEGFLDDLFVKVLGYTKNPNPNYNLVVEQKNVTDSKKADGALLDDEKVVGVIELKGTETTDLSKVEAQAFGYKNKQPDASYVIISNFEKLRFYIDNAVDFIEFNLFTLTKEEFKILWLCLSNSNLLKGLPKKIKEASLTEEETVTKKLYKDYSAFKNDIFESVTKHNPEHDKLLLFKKTQKLLDRFLFIFFAEDRLLLPPNSIRQIIQQWMDLRDTYDEYVPLYERFKKYFGYLNEGRNAPGKDEIFAYNGGLFEPDTVLDNLTIDDDLLYKHTLQLSKYDFETEIDVNILGHIFEHSLNEIEEINAELKGEQLDASRTRRKKDGVFYTPKYITKYIVEHTVGQLCEEKKAALALNEEAYVPNRQKKTKQVLLDTLDAYRDYLFSLTICDPACGSGAFLNQALEFLMEEHRFVSELEAKLLNRPFAVFDVESQILEKNLFGVDINEESVEIAKLSLWLRTAQKGRKLTSLNHNVKCGNSLIDDPEVAGDKAFTWEKEFPTVFRQKEKQAFHVTWVSHNARTSQRMIEYKVKKGETIWLDEDLEMVVANELATIITEDKLNVLNWNICGDHVHMLLVCEPDELANIVRKLKGRSAQKTKEYLKVPKEEVFHLWAQKFNRRPIEDEDGLSNVYDYIQHNREKHNLPLNKELQLLVEQTCCSYDKAFQSEYSGGFDVVIGNPPYVRQELVKQYSEFLKKEYEVYAGKADLYTYFFEKAVSLLKTNGHLSFITSGKFFEASYGKVLVSFLVNKTSLDEVINFDDLEVFEGISAYPLILSLKNIPPQKDHNFKYCYVPYQKFEILEEIVHNLSFSEIALNDFINYEFQFFDRNTSQIIRKVNTNSFYLHEKDCLPTVGVKTGYNDGYITNFETSNFIKPYLFGRDLKRYTSPVSSNNIIFPYKVVDGSYKLIEESELSSAKPKLQGNKERLSNRAIIKDGLKKGSKRWYEYQQINKAIDFESEFIVFPNVSLGCNFTLSKGSVIDMTGFIILSNDKVLLALLNSSLTKFIMRNIAITRRGGYQEFKIQYLKQIPLKEINAEVRKVIESSVNNLFRYNNELRVLQEKYLDFLLSKFDIDKLSRKLENWHELSFKQFLAELEKARKKAAMEYKPLPLQEQAEWMDYFNEQKVKADELKTQIAHTDKEIDQMVYAQYGLTEEEIKIVEQSR